MHFERNIVLLNAAIFALSMALVTAAIAQPEKAANAADKERREKVVQEDRLRILRDERAQIQKQLAASAAAMPDAKNQDEASKVVNRLQGDLKAIESEIQRVEGQKPLSAPVPAKAAPSGQQEEDKKTPVFKSWDVFNNFGK